MNDDDLNSKLAGWKPPSPPSGLSDRIWEQFEGRRRPWLARLFERRLTLPLPAVAAAGLLILTLGSIACVALWKRTTQGIVVQTRIVRVPVAQEPVVRERLVTRTVTVRPPAPSCPPPVTPHSTTELRATALTLAGFEPLSEIRPQIIRRNFR